MRRLSSGAANGAAKKELPHGIGAAPQYACGSFTHLQDLRTTSPSVDDGWQAENRPEPASADDDAAFDLRVHRLDLTDVAHDLVGKKLAVRVADQHLALAERGVAITS